MTHLLKFLKHARAILLVVCLVLAAAGCNRSRPTEAAASADVQPPEVKVVQAEVRPIDLTIPITGSLVSTVQVDVRTEVSGRLIQAPPREGEHVQKGQVLARQDDSNYRLAEQQARAGVGVAEAGVQRSRTAVEHADREMERARQVQSTGGITVKDFQGAEFASRDARAQLRLAEAQLQQAKDALATAEKKARDTVILAPFSGIVQTRNFNEGIFLDLKEVLARLVDNSQLEMEATVPSADLGRLQPGQRVRFTVDSFPNESFSGSVVRLAPAMTEASRSIRVRIQVPNPADRLKAGMFARGDIITGTRKDALLLAAAAVLRSAADPRKASVIVIANNTVQRREIELGNDHQSRVEVLRGLQASEWVMADPSMAPADGGAVRTAARKQ